MPELLIHVVDEQYPDTHLELCNPEKTLQIDVKWDGCVNIRTTCNGYTVDQKETDNHDDIRDYIHICDLQLFINQLQEALNRAKEKGFELD